MDRDRHQHLSAAVNRYPCHQAIQYPDQKHLEKPFFWAVKRRPLLTSGKDFLTFPQQKFFGEFMNTGSGNAPPGGCHSHRQRPAPYTEIAHKNSSGTSHGHVAVIRDHRWQKAGMRAK